MNYPTAIPFLRAFPTALVAALTLAPAAHADTSTDGAFVAGERSGGITGPVSTLIANGHAICYDIDVAGMTPAAAQNQVWLHTDVDQKHSIWFTVVAISSYCPWDNNLMPGQTDATGNTVPAS
jgi:hypothetical protein